MSESRYTVCLIELVMAAGFKAHQTIRAEHPEPAKWFEGRAAAMVGQEFFSVGRNERSIIESATILRLDTDVYG